MDEMIEQNSPLESETDKDGCVQIQLQDERVVDHSELEREELCVAELDDSKKLTNKKKTGSNSKINVYVGYLL